MSYRRDDSKWQARPIHEAFCRAVPRDHVFMDIDSIPPGANFRKTLKAWVDQCDVLLALIGPGWIDAADPRTGRRRLENPSDLVRIEIGEALARDIPVVPVLLDGAPMPEAERLPGDLKELADRQAELVEFRTFDADAQRLIRKLRVGEDRSVVDASVSPRPEAAGDVPAPWLVPPPLFAPSTPTSAPKSAHLAVPSMSSPSAMTGAGSDSEENLAWIKANVRPSGHLGEVDTRLEMLAGMLRFLREFPRGCYAREAIRDARLYFDGIKDHPDSVHYNHGDYLTSLLDRLERELPS